MQGKFITLEGIEGSGKSTNLVTIKSILDQYKIDYVLTREPGGGPLGPHLRKLLLDKDQSISPSVEMLLMMADRKDHVDNLINPNLDKGIWVISDRYLDSTIAYQGGGRQLDINLITSLSASLKLPTPDLTLLFDLPVDVALDRAKERSELDRFEKTLDASVYEMIPVILLIISILFVGLYPSFITGIFKNGIIQIIG